VSPTVSLTIIMSDCDKAEINMISTMYPDLKLLLCRWNMLHAMQMHYCTEEFLEVWAHLHKLAQHYSHSPCSKSSSLVSHLSIVHPHSISVTLRHFSTALSAKAFSNLVAGCSWCVPVLGVHLGHFLTILMFSDLRPVRAQDSLPLFPYI